MEVVVVVVIVDDDVMRARDPVSDVSLSRATPTEVTCLISL